MTPVPSSATSSPFPLSTLEIGGARVEIRHDTPGRWYAKLQIGPAQDYADAQLDDHRHLPRPRFPHRPPLHLSLRARTSVPAPPGTFGFGLWNDPFSLNLGQGGAARRLPTAPQALWFFYGSLPTDLALVPGVPGHGWKASCLRSRQVPALLLAPLAPAALAAKYLAPLRRIVFALSRQFYQASEALLPTDPALWHHYEIDWGLDSAEFRVDERPVLSSTHPPTTPLGLVLWMDNQYAALSPQKGVGFGVLKIDAEEWIEIADLDVENPPAAARSR